MYNFEFKRFMRDNVDEKIKLKQRGDTQISRCSQESYTLRRPSQY